MKVNLSDLAHMLFIAAVAFISYTAMTMTNNVHWCWFMLFGLFAL